MRFEKINENKLKIELSREDLLERNIKLSDIAFGAENSRQVLHEIMAQAFEELEFEADNKPLVIEAVPTSGFSINIFITKIKDEAEFEENMNKVSQQGDKNFDGLKLLEKFANDFEKLIGNSGVDGLGEMPSTKTDNKTTGKQPQQGENQKTQSKVNDKSILEKTEIIYKFEALDHVIDLSKAINNDYKGKSTLYKHDDKFYLLLNAKGYEKIDIVKLRLLLDEFGEFVSTHRVAQGFLNEHASIVVKTDVFKKLEQV